MEDYILIANIRSVYNSSGYLSLESFSDFPERFFELRTVIIHVFGVYKELAVEDVRASGENILLKLKNFDSDDDAGFLTGSPVYVRSSQAVKPGEDVYFIHDLIGSKVLRNNEFFGTLEDVVQLPANDIYVVRSETGEEIMIPAVKDYVERFDPDRKELILKPGSETLYDDED